MAFNCRARSPSRSTGAQSPTTDIILIAHHGRVVCPHSHPDSVCAEKPNNGKQWFECVWRFADSSECPLCLS